MLPLHVYASCTHLHTTTVSTTRQYRAQRVSVTDNFKMTKVRAAYFANLIASVIFPVSTAQIAK